MEELSFCSSKNPKLLGCRFLPPTSANPTILAIPAHSPSVLAPSLHSTVLSQLFPVKSLVSYPHPISSFSILTFFTWACHFQSHIWNLIIGTTWPLTTLGLLHSGSTSSIPHSTWRLNSQSWFPLCPLHESSSALFPCCTPSLKCSFHQGRCALANRLYYISVHSAWAKSHSRWIDAFPFASYSP